MMVHFTLKAERSTACSVASCVSDHSKNSMFWEKNDRSSIEPFGHEICYFPPQIIILTHADSYDVLRFCMCINITRLHLLDCFTRLHYPNALPDLPS
jgi:hypothetical protein